MGSPIWTFTVTGCVRNATFDSNCIAEARSCGSSGPAQTHERMVCHSGPTHASNTNGHYGGLGRKAYKDTDTIGPGLERGNSTRVNVRVRLVMACGKSQDRAARLQMTETRRTSDKRS